MAFTAKGRFKFMAGGARSCGADPASLAPSADERRRIPSLQHEPPADPRRDKLLRSLHPDARRRRARRWRWLRVALALLPTGSLFVWLASAHQAALRATSDNDPAIGYMFLAGGLFCLSLGVFVVLLGIALCSDIAHLVRHDR